MSYLASHIVYSVLKILRTDRLIVSVKYNTGIEQSSGMETPATVKHKMSQRHHDYILWEVALKAMTSLLRTNKSEL